MQIKFIKRNSKCSERDAVIHKERASGKTLEEIGNTYGLTRERVRQICESVQGGPGFAYLDRKFQRLAAMLNIKKIQDFNTIKYSQILALYYTSSKMVQALDSNLQEYGAALIPDVDLESYSKHLYQKKGRKLKPGVKPRGKQSVKKKLINRKKSTNARA